MSRLHRNHKPGDPSGSVLDAIEEGILSPLSAHLHVPREFREWDRRGREAVEQRRIALEAIREQETGE